MTDNCLPLSSSHCILSVDQHTMDYYPLISPGKELQHKHSFLEDADGNEIIHYEDSVEDSVVDVDQNATALHAAPAGKFQGTILFLACGAAAVLALSFLHQSYATEPKRAASELRSSGSLLDILDLNEEAPCGRHKCFYRAKEDTNLGYLVAARTHIEELSQGWDFGNCLTSTYGAKHFMNDAPFETYVTDEMAEDLSSVAFSFSPKIDIPNFTSENVVVQEVVVAPTPHILLGCNKKKRDLEKLSYFDDFTGRVDNKEAFLKTFDDSVRSMFEILRSEPALMHDFQVILDTKGEMYYLDFTNAGAEWAVNAFNTTGYKNSISSCSKMVRPIYERMGASAESMDELDAYLEDQISDVKKLTGRSLDVNLRRKKKKNNACLRHLLP